MLWRCSEGRAADAGLCMDRPDSDWRAKWRLGKRAIAAEGRAPVTRDSRHVRTPGRCSLGRRFAPPWFRHNDLVVGTKFLATATQEPCALVDPGWVSRSLGWKLLVREGAEPFAYCVGCCRRERESVEAHEGSATSVPEMERLALGSPATTRERTLAPLRPRPQSSRVSREVCGST